MPVPNTLVRSLRRTSTALVRPVACRPSRQPISTSARCMAEHGGHEDHYDPPTGWLWGVPPGEKYKKEGWESIWYWGMYGSLVVAAIAYAGKPDSNIETWALEEAKRRLQAEGILPEEK